jgi:hypothetical protein
MSIVLEKAPQKFQVRTVTVAGNGVRLEEKSAWRQTWTDAEAEAYEWVGLDNGADLEAHGWRIVEDREDLAVVAKDHANGLTTYLSIEKF